MSFGYTKICLIFNLLIMKLAYIITVYKDPQHLLRLIKSLNIKADFYCHVDKKEDIEPFVNLLAPFKNVYFTENRYFVNWGSYAQVLSQKELLRMAMMSGEMYDRVICLSGLDYPIISNSRIQSLFYENQDKEYICGVNLSNPANAGLRSRVTIYHFFRDVKIRNILLKKCFSGSARILLKALPIRKDYYVNMGDKCWDVFMGSDYWALTYPCVKYVYKIMQDEKLLMNYFKYSFVPSEMCVQTIVFNSVFANQAMQSEKYTGLPPLTPLHYIVYNKKIKVFDENDYEVLVICGKMFFRKAMTGKSDRLIGLIDTFRQLQDKTLIEIEKVKAVERT